MQRLINLSTRLVKSLSFRRYLIIGVSTVILDYLILFILRAKKSEGLTPSVTAAYWLSIAYNYSLNKAWSFGAKSLTARQNIMYLSLLGINYLITLSAIHGLQSLGVSEYIGKMAALAITIPWTYYAYKHRIFKAINAQ